jgi:signal transduction histidine kinase
MEMMIAETTKILLVEDNPGDARLIREMLAEAGGDGFEHDAYVSFQVEDNGKGFDVTKVARDAIGGGLGLVAMDERVRMLGGSLEISSQEGQGTRVSFVVPPQAWKVNGVRYGSI